MTSDDSARHPGAVVFGCLGTALNDEERHFFRQCDPLGFILFARNCETPEQISALVNELRSVVGRDDAPVLIDQEGGRVQRLKPPLWPAYLSARELVERAGQNNPGDVMEAVRLQSRLIAHDLISLGINVNCTPVLDVPQPGTHEIIGDRAYGDDADDVSRWGRVVCDGMLAGGVMPVIKHIPGHGRAMADSHEELPVVTEPRAELERTDFAPFRDLSDIPWGMTGHLMFPDLDPDHSVTHSATIINDIIRRDLGFDGVLCSDDLSMKALGGSFRERAEKSLSAGCDLALHCNGDMAEMMAVAEGVGEMTVKSVARFEAGETLRHAKTDTSQFDYEAARAGLAQRVGGSV
jgi:beta-N-acetylhexosaminidase